MFLGFSISRPLLDFYRYPSLCLSVLRPSFMSDSATPWTEVLQVLQAGVLEWVAISSSRGCSTPRDWTFVSCIAGAYFSTESPGTANCILCYSIPVIWRQAPQPRAVIFLAGCLLHEGLQLGLLCGISWASFFPRRGGGSHTWSETDDQR